jgi:hypothetical protein
MEDIYLIHTYDSITTNKINKVEQIQLNILQHSRINNILFQIYNKIINFVTGK